MTIADLEQLRASIPNDDTLPLSTTRAELATIQQRRRDLDRRITQARTAMATLASLPTREADDRWQACLDAWRETLCSELLALPPRIRDLKLLAVQRNLTISIRTIDFGPSMPIGSGYDLTTLRLGQLMREAGYEPQGADPDANFVGTMPWFGSLRDLKLGAEKIERLRMQAQSALDDALLDDDARAKRDAEAAARVIELNKLPQRRTRQDGTQYDRYPDGRRVEVDVKVEVETS